LLPIVAVLLALAAESPSGFTLTIDSSQQKVFVGEPVKLTVRLKATRHIHGMPIGDEGELPVGLVRFRVDDGTRTRTYIDYSGSLDCRVLVQSSLAPYEEQVMTAVLFKGGYLDEPAHQPRDSLLFPVPGKFWIRLEYTVRGVTTLSNRLRFTVNDPTGDR
jgi:hypothetical protein